MAKPLLDDELWTSIEPLIPIPPRRFRSPGRKRRDHRSVLNGIVFVLLTGIPWEYLPREFGCCGMTCWRTPGGRDWQHAGVWDAMHRLLLNHLRAADQIDWSRTVVDSASVRAVGGGELTGPNPTDRGKPGCKHHVITDANGIPLAAIVTAANVNDVTQLLPLVDAIPPVAGRPGAPRRRPDAVQGDAGYRSQAQRINLWESVTPTTALILIAQWSDDPWALKTLWDRSTGQFHAQGFIMDGLQEDALWDWQWRWFAHVCLDLLDSQRAQAVRDLAMDSLQRLDLSFDPDIHRRVLELWPSLMSDSNPVIQSKSCAYERRFAANRAVDCGCSRACSQH